jgi:light-regulated signal transduction histidine kinase (bacteriophytochrome)
MSDITERNRRIKEIQTQNEKLKEIAWTQSHVVRAPLARLMGLVMEIQKNEIPDGERDELMKYVLNSAEELDEIIRNIVVKSKIVLNLESNNS